MTKNDLFITVHADPTCLYKNVGIKLFIMCKDYDQTEV